MKSDKAPNKKNRLRLIAAGIVLVIVSAFVFFSNYGLVNRLKLESRKYELVRELEEKKKVRDSLQKKTEALQNDLGEIERCAREKYGMVKPGEKIFIIEEENK